MVDRSVSFSDIWNEMSEISADRAKLLLGAVAALMITLIFDALLSEGLSTIGALAMTAFIQSAVIGTLLGESDGVRLIQCGGTLMMANLVTGAAIVIGLLLLVVPGILLMARWSLVAPLISREGKRVFAAIGESWSLTAQCQGAVIAISLIYIVLMGLAILLQQAAAAWSGLDASAWVVKVPIALVVDIVVVGGWVSAAAAYRALRPSTSEYEAVFG